MLARETARDAISPVDQRHSLSREVLVSAEIEKLRLGAQPIGVEMIDWQPRRILLQQDKRRTADNAGICKPQSPGDGPDKLGLARAKRSIKRHHGAREKQFTYPTAKRFRRLQGREIDRQRPRHGSPARFSQSVSGGTSAFGSPASKRLSCLR